jgi:predicted anti-sigma-YlaC factor YlaD
MTCKGVLAALSDYLEGDAGESLCKGIEEHIRGCERCRLHIDRMKVVIRAYKPWRDETCPVETSRRLKEAIAEEVERD